MSDDLKKDELLSNNNQEKSEVKDKEKNEAMKLTKADLIEKKEELENKNEELEAIIVSNKDTLNHIEKVRKFIALCINSLRERADNHDKSKLEEPEAEYFAKYTSKLSECTYGSDEYNKYLEELKPALDHHYAKSRHHPEHFPNGINDMTLIDLIEMLCDWKASSLRQHDGNILKSIENNTKRFKLSPQLAKIFKNTVEMFEHIKIA